MGAGGHGRCGNLAPTIHNPGCGQRQEFCNLTAGHLGWHRSDNGAEWSHGDVTARDAAPTPEGVVLGRADDREAHALLAHEFKPCSQTSPTVRAFWSRCYGCDWVGPVRDSHLTPPEDHREHLASLIAARLATERAAHEGLRAAVEAVCADGDHDAFCDQDDECECWRRRIRAALAAGVPGR